MEKKNIIKSVILIIALIIILFTLKAILPMDEEIIKVKELDDDVLYLEAQDVVNSLLVNEPNLANTFYIEDIYYKEKDGIKVLFIHGFKEILDNDIR